MARALKTEMDKIRKRFLLLGCLVEGNLRQVMKAFQEKDLDLAEKIRNSDNEVDDAEIGVEEECLRIFALHQPVASDLRFLVTILKINSDLERIGDLVAKIGKKVMRFLTPEKAPFYASLRNVGLVMPMFEKTVVMLRQSLDAFVKEDADLAYKVILMDDDIDEMKHEIRKELEALRPADLSQSEAVNALLGIASNIERIADHATNIAEDVIYMLQGKIVRHEYEQRK